MATAVAQLWSAFSFLSSQDQVCVLRSYIRQRDNLVRSAVSMCNACKGTHTNECLVTSSRQHHGHDRHGNYSSDCCWRHDPQTLATRHPHFRRVLLKLLKHYKAITARASVYLQQELALYEAYQVQLAANDAQIEQCPRPLESQLPVLRRKPQDNQPAFDLQTHLERISWR